MRGPLVLAPISDKGRGMRAASLLLSCTTYAERIFKKAPSPLFLDLFERFFPEVNVFCFEPGHRCKYEVRGPACDPLQDR